jgi:hypothetical protein
MDFLNELEEYNQSMQNAYLLITEKLTLDDIFDRLDAEDIQEFYLPFDPLEFDGKNEATLDLLIAHFIELEEYEKCQELNLLKAKNLKTL